MASWIGASGGKSQSQTGFNAAPLRSIDKNLVSVGGARSLNNELLGQITEALKTGGIGAQLPIMQQAVSQSRSALSDALQGSTDQLARAGLMGTPFGQRALADQRQTGLQQIAGIPTQMAQGFIAQGPQFAQGLLGQILGALQKSSSSSGPYAR